MVSRAPLVTLILSVAVQAQLSPSGIATQPTSAGQRIVQNYGKLPLTFEANQGQTDPKVKFLSRGSGYTLFLTNDEAVFSFHTGAISDRSPLTDKRSVPSTATSDVLQMKLHKANQTAKVVGLDEQQSRRNYFIGNDPNRWHRNLPTYTKVKCESVYPGIDLVYYGNERQLEYDFIVSPRADPRHIRFDLTGAEKIVTDSDGDLVLRMKSGDVRWHKPVVYQQNGDRRQEIAAHYVVERTKEVSFEIASYDRDKPLFIDPLLYSTYIGGSSDDVGLGIAVDGVGNAYITGYTTSSDFPVVNAEQSNNAGTYDVVVAKLSPGGSAIMYATYLGGAGIDTGRAISIDSQGNAYVTGYTASNNFPTVNPFQAAYGGGEDDIFIAQLDSTGSALVYSTYLGGSGDEGGLGIAVDSLGNAFVTGFTDSTDFPTVNPVQPTSGGVVDAFVAKLYPAGSSLFYSTYLGGNDQDYGYGIAVDSSGKAFVTGSTASSDFPIARAFQSKLNGRSDAFLTTISPLGSTLVFSTYLGGGETEIGHAIAVDTSGSVYVTGYTDSSDFPVVIPVQQTNGGGMDVFVSKFNSSGSALLFSTYLGGKGTDFAFGIAVDSSDDAYVVGETNSTNFPVLSPIQKMYGGGSWDGFVAQLNQTGSALVYSTYLGGSQAEQVFGVALDSAANAYVTGQTESTDFPILNALQPTLNGTSDVFVSEIFKAPAVTLTPTSLTFGNQTVGTTSSPQNVALTNSGDATLAITSIVATGDFSQTNNCPVGSALAAGSTCMITVSFAPTQAGSREGSVTVVDNAPGSSQTVPLQGTGVVPGVMLSPTTLSFPTTVVFTTGATQIVTLTNAGQGILTINSIVASSPFLQSNTCGTTVAPGATCTISVRFKPSTKGQVAGAVSISDNAPGSPQRVKLTGVGTFIQANPTSENFGGQPVGTTSIARQVIVSNKGNSTVSISSIAITGTNAGDFAETNTCGTSLASGASCKIVVTFTPTAKGKRIANVSITDNGGGSPQTVSLSGTGT